MEDASIRAVNEATSAELYASIAVAGRSVAEIIAVTAAKARVAKDSRRNSSSCNNIRRRKSG